MNKLKISLEQGNYNRFGLFENPFPYSGVPVDEPNFYVGQDEVINIVSNVLSTTIVTGKSNHLIITGSYGNGKSHTLRYIKSTINNQFSEGNHSRVCVGKVSNLGNSFLDIYSNFVYDLGYDFIKSNAEEFLGLIALEMLEKGLLEEEVSSKNGWESIMKGEILLPNVVPYALIKLNNIVKYMDFTKAFLNLAYGDNSVDAWEWISGEGIDHIKRRQIGLLKCLDEKNAVKAFVSLKKTLNYLNYSTVFLLIDEFEYVESLQIVAKQKMLNTIRHLIDMNPEGLSTIIACTPEVWQSFASEYHAFSERIANEANLKPLNNGSTKKLILEYLNTARKVKSDSLDPFTEDSVNAIFQKGMGNTRNTLILCNQALDKAINFQVNELNERFVSSIVKN